MYHLLNENICILYPVILSMLSIFIGSLLIFISVIQVVHAVVSAYILKVMGGIYCLCIFIFLKVIVAPKGADGCFRYESSKSLLG